MARIPGGTLCKSYTETSILCYYMISLVLQTYLWPAGHQKPPTISQTSYFPCETFVTIILSQEVTTLWEVSI